MPEVEINGGAPAEAPQAAPAPAAAEPVAAVEPVAGAPTEGNQEPPVQAAETLYALPDGRQVTGEELRRLHVEELLPEFTRRSQELHTLKTQQQPQPQPAPQEQQQEWVPQTWEEVRAAAAQEAIATLRAQDAQEQQVRTDVVTAIDTTLAEIKATDPTLNEGQLFAHATKYKFSDLKLAHQNMKDMALVAKSTEARTTQNIQNRQGQPIAGASKGGGSISVEGVDYGAIRDESPLEMLRRIQNKT